MRYFPVMICAALACPAQAQETMRLGVFGVVEKVNPLVVAGREVRVPEGLPVISPLGPGLEISVGDTLALVVRPEEGRLVAVRMLEIYPIVGPVSEVTASTATVMGTQVHLPPDTSVRVGTAIAVSGLWSGETVITTAIRRIEWQGFGQLVGPLDSAGPLRMGKTGISGAQAPQDGFGDHVWMLSGEPAGNQLSVRLMAKGVFGGNVDLALWQGYASAPIASQTYMIHGTGIVGTARDAQMPGPGTLVTRCAHDGRVIRDVPKAREAAFALLDCARYIPVD